MDDSNAKNTMNDDNTVKTVLITGAAKRVGAVTAETLHQAGYNIVIHCRISRQTADELAEKLNKQRPNSAKVIQANITDETVYNHLIKQAYQCWGRIEVLIKIAESFFPTPIGTITLTD